MPTLSHKKAIGFGVGLIAIVHFVVRGIEYNLGSAIVADSLRKLVLFGRGTRAGILGLLALYSPPSFWQEIFLIISRLEIVTYGYTLCNKYETYLFCLPLSKVAKVLSSLFFRISVFRIIWV